MLPRAWLAAEATPLPRSDTKTKDDDGTTSTTSSTNNMFSLRGRRFPSPCQRVSDAQGPGPCAPCQSRDCERGWLLVTNGSSYVFSGNRTAVRGRVTRSAARCPARSAEALRCFACSGLWACWAMLGMPGSWQIAELSVTGTVHLYQRLASFETS